MAVLGTFQITISRQSRKHISINFLPFVNNKLAKDKIKKKKIPREIFEICEVFKHKSVEC